MENIEQLERRLWEAADQLRANSKLTSTEYYMPVLGLIFLRHAYNRFLVVEKAIRKNLPSRGGVTRPVIKEDFDQKNALFLAEKTQYEYLLNLPSGQDRGKAIIEAMDGIEDDYPSLNGVLPKEYHIFEPALLSRFSTSMINLFVICESGKEALCITSFRGLRINALWSFSGNSMPSTRISSNLPPSPPVIDLTQPIRYLPHN